MYDYASASAWVDDLHGERDPHVYDLCDRHGVKVSVPKGWRLIDRRSRVVIAFPQRMAG